jgi:ABC-type phosphate transport system substrate-binding protein
VHFIGSESALTPTEISTYNANASGITGWGPLIQVPAIGTSVLIPYKRAGISDLNLTDAKMCAIFRNRGGGQTWGQVRGTADTTTVKLIYRTDPSGTTELLSRYLVAACPDAGFVVSSSFATMVSGALVPANVIPTHWIGVTGSAGVTAALAVDSRIGYLSPEPLYTGSGNVLVARINGHLPVASSIRNSLAKQRVPKGPLDNPSNWLPDYAMPVPGTEYPIFGTSNLLLNQCYQDAAIQTKVRNLLTALTGTTHDAKIADHNFVVLPDGTLSGTPPAGNNNWKKTVSMVFLSPTSSLSIGHPSVCNGKGRPLSN